MIPQRSDVTQLVLSLLGDTAVSGGSIFVASFQAPYLNAAFQEMLSRLSVAGGDRIQREGYYVLAANTAALAPVTAGWTNFGWPEEIRERAITGQYAVSAVTPSSPAAGQCSVTLSQALPASVASGTMLETYGINGVSEDVNSSWAITLTDTTHIILNGCTASGTYTNGGQVVYAPLDWSDPLQANDTTDIFPLTSQSELGMYSYSRGVLRFPSCATQRELKVVYNLSGSLPVVSNPVSTDSMGLDDSLNFLAHRTAQLCAAAKGNPRAQQLQQQADYFLGIMLAGAARALQSGQAIVPQQFRPKRNVRAYSW